MTPVTDESVEFDCPRCGEHALESFYGPCRPCREVLRSSVTGSARDLEAPAYEPKMNVTPNAVALKE